MPAAAVILAVREDIKVAADKTLIPSSQELMGCCGEAEGSHYPPAPWCPLHALSGVSGGGGGSQSIDFEKEYSKQTRATWIPQLEMVEQNSNALCWLLERRP